jgi:hypothetical protein
MVKAELFDRGMHRIWCEGDRFRMYFGGRAGSKQGNLSVCLFLHIHEIAGRHSRGFQII